MKKANLVLKNVNKVFSHYKPLNILKKKEEIYLLTLYKLKTKKVIKNYLHLNVLVL